MADTGILDIDSEEDYQLMQIIAGYLFEAREDFQAVSLRAMAWLKALKSAEN